MLAMDIRSETLRISCGFEDCRRIFFNNTDYNRHQKSHERPYKCSICDKAFGMKSDRDRHRAIHRTNPFIFRCKFPGCKFKGTPRRDYLLRHMRKSHESSRDSGSKDSVRFYYQKSSIEATVSESEETLLAFLDAVGQGDETLVKEFISTKVDFCGKDSRGTTAGDIAAAKGYRGILQLLVNAGTDVNSNTSDPWLHQALRNGHLKTAEFLLEVGADINAKASFGYGSSTLFEEVLLSSSESAIALVEKYQSLPPEQSRLQLLLNEAIEHEDLPRITRLLDLSANVVQMNCDRKDSGYIQLPLHVAARQGAVSVAAFLLEHGANVEAENSLGQTALYEAIRNNHLPMVEFLLEQSPPGRARFGTSPPELVSAFVAASYSLNSANLAMTHLLLEKGANIKNPELYQIQLIKPICIHDGPGGLDLSRAFYMTGNGHSRLVNYKTRVYLSNSMTDLLIDLVKTKRDYDPPTMVKAISYMRVSEYCLDLWQREARNGYDEALLESIVTVIRVLVLGEAKTIKWKEWEQFPVEVQSRLASFTTPDAN